MEISVWVLLGIRNLMGFLWCSFNALKQAVIILFLNLTFRIASHGLNYEEFYQKTSVINSWHHPDTSTLNSIELLKIRKKIAHMILGYRIDSSLFNIIHKDNSLHVPVNFDYLTHRISCGRIVKNVLIRPFVAFHS